MASLFIIPFMLRCPADKAKWRCGMKIAEMQAFARLHQISLPISIKAFAQRGFKVNMAFSFAGSELNPGPAAVVTGDYAIMQSAEFQCEYKILAEQKPFHFDLKNPEPLLVDGLPAFQSGNMAPLKIFILIDHECFFPSQVWWPIDLSANARFRELYSEVVVRKHPIQNSSVDLLLNCTDMEKGKVGMWVHRAVLAISCRLPEKDTIDFTDIPVEALNVAVYFAYNRKLPPMYDYTNYRAVINAAAKMGQHDFVSFLCERFHEHGSIMDKNYMLSFEIGPFTKAIDLYMCYYVVRNDVNVIEFLNELPLEKCPLTQNVCFSIIEDRGLSVSGLSNSVKDHFLEFCLGTSMCHLQVVESELEQFVLRETDN